MVRPRGLVRFGADGDCPFLVHLVALAGNAPRPIYHLHPGCSFRGPVFWVRSGSAMHLQLSDSARLLCFWTEIRIWNVSKRNAASRLFCFDLCAGSGPGAAALAG